MAGGGCHAMHTLALYPQFDPNFSWHYDRPSFCQSVVQHGMPGWSEGREKRGDYTLAEVDHLSAVSGNAPRHFLLPFPAQRYSKLASHADHLIKRAAKAFLLGNPTRR